jgi:hypothetical protein
MVYDGPYMLALFNRMSGRAVLDKIDAPTKYQWLSEAQDEVVMEVARVAPHVLYPKVGTASMPQMVTTDNNVFTFGVDDDEQPIIPFGDAQIYRRTTDIPDRPMRPGWDYVNEASQIRLPRNKHISSTLYWRGIRMPNPISADTAPALVPAATNVLTAIRATMNFAESGNIRNAALADRMRVRWKERWPGACLLWKRQFAKGGALIIWSARDAVTPLL